MSRMGGYQVELAMIEKDLVELREKALANPESADAVTKYAYRFYQHASLTGNLEAIGEVEKVIDGALQTLGPAQDLCLLKANLDFKLHRLAETKGDLESSPGLAETHQGRTLLADIAFQEGRYAEAKSQFEALIEEERKWDNLARLAFLTAKMGDVQQADELYAEAEDEITAKEMRSFAWVELQRGVLDLTYGRSQEADEHYQRADRAYPGYWLVDEHMAALLGQQHKFEDAAALYEKVLREVAKPELQQALGQLYASMGKSQQAELWQGKALNAYLRSAERGHVHYYHHLVEFYVEVRTNANEAVKWATKDLALRKNFSTQTALAEALCLAGHIDEAVKTIDQALSSGVKDTRLFQQAGRIYKAAGRRREAEHYLHLAEAINPHLHHFHVHHH